MSPTSLKWIAAVFLASCLLVQEVQSRPSRRSRPSKPESRPSRQAAAAVAAQPYASPVASASYAQSYPYQAVQSYPAAAPVDTAALYSNSVVQSWPYGASQDGSIHASGLPSHIGAIGSGDSHGNMFFLSCFDCGHGRR